MWNERKVPEWSNISPVLVPGQGAVGKSFCALSSTKGMVIAVKIIGRTNEIGILEYCYNSTQSEFVAIYGRRRVGKTFLVRELFKDRITFYASGVFNEGMESQLAQWNREIAGFGYEGIKDADNWLDAFGNLHNYRENIA